MLLAHQPSQKSTSASFTSCCWFSTPTSFMCASLLMNDDHLLSPMSNDAVVTQVDIGCRVWKTEARRSFQVARIHWSVLFTLGEIAPCITSHRRCNWLLFFFNGGLKMIWNQFNINVSLQSTAFNIYFFSCITGDHFYGMCPRWRKPWSVLIPIQLTSVQGKATDLLLLSNPPHSALANVIFHLLFCVK